MARKSFDSGVLLPPLIYTNITNPPTVTGISAGCTKSSSVISVPNYEDTLGQYQNSTLDALDSVLTQLHTAGIKAIISPHDANNLPPSGSNTGYNGIDIYGKTYTSSDNFYSSADAKAKYDARLASILNYRSKAFGKAWKDASEVILAFDIQNEPMIASADKAKNNDPDDWICGRAGNMKKILGNSVGPPPFLPTPVRFLEYFV
jgi:mannan endo-1,4-beta-mannosidase